MSIEIEILRPLQKVEVVVSKEGGPRVGSIGYIGYIDPTILASQMLIDICFSRSGKTGKPRIMNIPIGYYPLNYDTITSEELTSLGFNHNTLLKSVDYDSTDVRDFTSYEFLCYLYSFSNFIVNLNNANRVTGAGISNMMSRNNIIGYSEEVGMMTITDLYAFINSCSLQFKAADAHILIDKVVSYFDNTANRSIFMDKAHKLFSVFNSTLKEYNSKLQRTYITYGKSLLNNLNKRIKPNEEKDLDY